MNLVAISTENGQSHNNFLQIGNVLVPAYAMQMQMYVMSSQVIGIESCDQIDKARKLGLGYPLCKDLTKLTDSFSHLSFKNLVDPWDV